MLVNNKQGMELTFQTIVVFIISLVVFLVVVFYFTGSFSENSSFLFNLGNESISSAAEGSTE